MPSQRRIRALLYIALAGFVTLLFFTSQARHSRDVDFYSKTVDALGRNRGGDKSQVIIPHDHDADGDIDEDDTKMAKEMAERLRQAEQKAKENANAKAPNKPDAPEAVIGVGSAAGGQHQGAPDKDGKVKETAEEHEIEVELNSILQKSPVIIFSKSYCPYSKLAKGILLDKYVIEPKPYVVELDLHPLGAQIQARLGEITGRRTVPNIMIYGKSIGGGDDIAALDKEKKLADKIKSVGGDRVKAAERFGNSPKAA
ncbi:putative monothiol glutaredoxin-6 precursor [Podospora fimiseda]|uniref:Monothiol glutaredoxin-6 n=1 Tax=Podospora fimiseda TaxID=252190 RepID=A0AAN7BWK5_9PEZI|nr:putative monothiol glutaredoxin-6 precursor [Podospora fimiseda]